MSGLSRVVLVWIFWSAAVLTLYTYVGYPVWIYARSRLHARRWSQTTIWPTVSIVLAVHNGAPLLRRQIDRLLSLNYPAALLDLVVVSDGSTDDTNDILKSILHPAMKFFLCPERRGKAAAINVGIQNATGEILMFVDVRPWLEQDALALLVSNFSDVHVGCASGELVLHDEGHTAGADVVSSTYWRYEQWIRKCESQVDSPIGVCGAFYAARRELVQALPEATVLDDMLQPLSIIRQGYRSVLDNRARVHDVFPKNLQSEFDRKVRTLAGNFQLLRLAPWILSRENRLRFELLSHKFLRLLVPIFLLLLLITSAILGIHSRLFALGLAAQVLFYGCAVLGVWTGLPLIVRVSGVARAFCVMNLAVVVGFYKFLFTSGPLWTIWVPTAPFATTSSTNKDKTPAASGI